MNARQISEWFLSKQSMSLKKMQKLVYYAYAWYLTLMNDRAEDLNNRLFDESIKAWVHGPVVYSLYKDYKDYRYNEIPQGDVDESVYTEDALDVLNQVWDVYGCYNANELESITHQEEPWIEAREGLTPLQNGYKSINDKTIYTHYLKQASED